MRVVGKWVIGIIAVVAVAVTGVVLFGPREPVDTTIAFDPADLPADLKDFDAHLAAAEAAVANLKPEVPRRIVWAAEPGVRTPYSIVYLHGFTATSEEIRPVPDRLAAAIGANLYFTRLSGHGRDGAAIGGQRAGDWIEDTAEAMEIGRRIGERVLVVATSTGGNLAAIAAADKVMSDGLAGIVFVSPNFAIANPLAAALGLPWVRHWGPLLFGSIRSFEPVNDGEAYFWTNHYPAVAVVSVKALVDHTAEIDFAALTIPALFFYSNEDRTVRPEATRDVFVRWGGSKQLEPRRMGPGDDAKSHVIAGDVLSPGQTDETAAIMIDWARALIAVDDDLATAPKGGSGGGKPGEG